MERNYGKTNRLFSYLAASALGVALLAQLIMLVMTGISYIGLYNDGVKDSLRLMLSSLIGLPALLLQVFTGIMLLVRKKNWLSAIVFALPVLYALLIENPVQILCQGNYSLLHILSSFLTYALRSVPLVLFYAAVVIACCTKGAFPGKKWGILLLLLAAALYVSNLAADFVLTSLLSLFKWIFAGVPIQWSVFQGHLMGSIRSLLPSMLLNIPIPLTALAFFLPCKETPAPVEEPTEEEETEEPVL